MDKNTQKLQKSQIAKIEEDVLKFWKESRAFEESLKRTKKGKKFVFFEGPPTANGRPGIHHVLARSFKDVVLRYKTMKGFYIPRRAGWDTHGLPVELEVEKRLGIKAKPEIEKYGIEKFNQECKKSVWVYKDEWEKITDRMAFWLDIENAYITYKPDYIETLWWVIKQFHKSGFLEQDDKVIPYCARCGTGLSSHELAQGYETVKDKSVYVKFKFVTQEGLKTRHMDEYFLVWTTTPWTLPSNVALAVNPNLDYARVEVDGSVLILAKDRLSVLEGKEYAVRGYIKGKDLVGLRYEQLFDFVRPKEDAFFVVAGDFVSATDGSGIVHIAPAYGQDDMEVAKKNNLPVIYGVKENGEFVEQIPWQGKFVKNADPEIIENLKERGLLYKEEMYEHEYPFCWRCKTPLLYFAKKSWFVKTTKVKEKILNNNKNINWVPAHLKEGRFGEWLRDNKDWAFSRARYWGTPLPVWQCEKCDSEEVIGSVAELSERSKTKNKYFIIRHGEATQNVKNIVDSSDKAKNKLTKKGIAEVKKAAAKLKKENISLIISSPFERTKETSEILSKELGVKKVIFDALIKEINTGIFDGKKSKEYHAYFTSLYEKFEKRPPKGETLRDLKKRMMKAFEKYESKYSGKNILIVCHEYPLWMLETALLGYDEKKSADVKLKIKSGDYIKTGEAKLMKIGRLPFNAEGELDLHRPYVDYLDVDCGKCGGKMKRAPEVCDVWFDSGAMPFAQAHFPFACAKVKSLKSKVESFGVSSSETDLKKLVGCIDFPADYISEAVDQTRGWFYTLLAVSSLLGLEAPYKNVISLGHILDKNGKKMSKSLGNIVNPWEMADKYGMDSIRWYFYIANPPGEPKRFDEKDLLNYQRKHVMALLNIFNFLKSYSDKKIKKSKIVSKNILDRWVLARLNETIKKATELMESYDIQSSARELADFVEDFSNWYIRRSRRRLQYKEEDRKDFEQAQSTMAFVLEELLKLTAPFTPFVADHIWRRLGNKKSIHLENYPQADAKKIDSELLENMKTARGLASEALQERMKAGLKVRQPLAKLKVKSLKLKDKYLAELIKEEVNVKEVVVDEKIEGNVWLDVNVTQELKEEGMLRDVIRNIQEERKNRKLTKKDFIKIQYLAKGVLADLMAKYQDEIKKNTLTKSLEPKDILKNPVQAKIDSEEMNFEIKKVK